MKTNEVPRVRDGERPRPLRNTEANSEWQFSGQVSKSKGITKRGSIESWKTRGIENERTVAAVLSTTYAWSQFSASAAAAGPETAEATATTALAANTGNGGGYLPLEDTDRVG